MFGLDAFVSSWPKLKIDRSMHLENLYLERKPFVVVREGFSRAVWMELRPESKLVMSRKRGWGS